MAACRKKAGAEVRLSVERPGHRTLLGDQAVTGGNRDLESDLWGLSGRRDIEPLARDAQRAYRDVVLQDEPGGARRESPDAVHRDACPRRDEILGNAIGDDTTVQSLASQAFHHVEEGAPAEDRLPLSVEDEILRLRQPKDRRKEAHLAAGVVHPGWGCQG